MQVRACHSLAKGLSWGPYDGSINSSNKHTQESDKMVGCIFVFHASFVNEADVFIWQLLILNAQSLTYIE